VKHSIINYAYTRQSRMGSIALYDLLYDIFYEIIILYLHYTNIMTNSISYRLIYLVWIDRMHNKWMNEFSRLITLCLYKNYVLKLNSLLYMLLALQVMSETPFKPNINTHCEETLTLVQDIFVMLQCFFHLCSTTI